MWDFLITNPEVASAFGTIFSAITAAIALITTFWGLAIQRRHNILSVCPKANFVFGNYEDDIYIKLTNVGIGPLIIKKLYIKKNQEIFESIKASLGNEFNNIEFRDYVESVTDRVIPPGDNLMLIRYMPREDNRNDQEYKRLLRKHLSQLECVVEFIDLYEKKHPVTRRKGDHFAN